RRRQYGRETGASLLPPHAERRGAGPAGAGSRPSGPLAENGATRIGHDMSGAPTTARPSRGVVRVVELAARALPGGDVRRRYEREFVTELYGLDRPHQL